MLNKKNWQIIWLIIITINIKIHQINFYCIIAIFHDDVWAKAPQPSEMAFMEFLWCFRISSFSIVVASVEWEINDCWHRIRLSSAIRFYWYFALTWQQTLNSFFLLLLYILTWIQHNTITIQLFLFLFRKKKRRILKRKTKCVINKKSRNLIKTQK